MSLARVAVFFLNLVSLGAVLFTILMIVSPFWIAPAMELPGTGMEAVPAGCFVAYTIVFVFPLSLLPAFAGWFIRERWVLPQEAAERRWKETEPWREERLRAWAGFVADFLLWQPVQVGVPDDSVPARLQSEVPRAFQELDRGRRERFMLFLREIGLERSAKEFLAQGIYLVDAEPVRKPIRLTLVRSAAAGFFLTSAFFLLWAGLTVLALSKYNLIRASGIDYGYFQYVLGVCVCLIPALVFGMAGVGLLRMARRAMRSFDQSNAGGRPLEALVLHFTLARLEVLREQRRSKRDAAALIRRIARAVVLMDLLALGGENRGKLLQALFESGWLTGTDALSLEGASFRAAELSGINLPHVTLAGIDLSGADLSGANLKGADLHKCILRGSDLRSCCLTGADLRGADLRSARLQRASLEQADLGGTLLDDANFWGVALSGADFSGSRGVAEFLSFSEIRQEGAHHAEL